MGEVVTTIPTIGFNVEQVTYKNLKFQVWDLGGQTSIRPYWRCYYSNTDAVIYVVDSADRDRIGISKQELVSMLEVKSKVSVKSMMTDLRKMYPKVQKSRQIVHEFTCPDFPSNCNVMIFNPNFSLKHNLVPSLILHGFSVKSQFYP